LLEAKLALLIGQIKYSGQDQAALKNPHQNLKNTLKALKGGEH